MVHEESIAERVNTTRSRDSEAIYERESKRSDASEVSVAKR